MASKIDLFKIVRPECVRCNFTECICPTTKDSLKVISAIKEVRIKGNKWVTEIYGGLDYEVFCKLKKILGTGGTYEREHGVLRGKILNRVRDVLIKLDYKLL